MDILINLKQETSFVSEKQYTRIMLDLFKIFFGLKSSFPFLVLKGTLESYPANTVVHVCTCLGVFCWNTCSFHGFGLYTSTWNSLCCYSLFQLTILVMNFKVVLGRNKIFNK